MINVPRLWLFEERRGFTQFNRQVSVSRPDCQMGGKSKDMIPVNGSYAGLKPGMKRLSPLESFTSIRPMGGGRAAASSSSLSQGTVWTGDDGSCPRRIGPVVEQDRSLAMSSLMSAGRHGRLDLGEEQ